MHRWLKKYGISLEDYRVARASTRRSHGAFSSPNPAILNRRPSPSEEQDDRVAEERLRADARRGDRRRARERPPGLISRGARRPARRAEIRVGEALDAIDARHLRPGEAPVVEALQARCARRSSSDPAAPAP